MKNGPSARYALLLLRLADEQQPLAVRPAAQIVLRPVVLDACHAEWCGSARTSVTVRAMVMLDSVRGIPPTDAIVCQQRRLRAAAWNSDRSPP